MLRVCDAASTGPADFRLQQFCSKRLSSPLFAEEHIRRSFRPNGHNPHRNHQPTPTPAANRKPAHRHHTDTLFSTTHLEPPPRPTHFTTPARPSTHHQQTTRHHLDPAHSTATYTASTPTSTNYHSPPPTPPPSPAPSPPHRLPSCRARTATPAPLYAACRRR